MKIKVAEFSVLTVKPVEKTSFYIEFILHYTIMNEKLEEKIRRLEEKILSAHRFNQELFAKLNRAQYELGILDSGRPFCPFLRPHFFTRKKYQKIARAAEILAGAFELMTQAALENQEIINELDLTEAEERMARIDPGYSGVSNSSRLDSFLCGEDFKFLEYNAETPAGITDQMQIEKVLEMIPEVREFLNEHEHWRPAPQEKLLEALVQSYHDFGGKKEKPNIAIVDWKEVKTSAEFEVLREYFESMGHKTIITRPRKLEYDGKILRSEDFEIDIFYKRVIIHEFLEEFDDTQPLVRAYQDGNIFMANSFRTKIPHKKASFAVLSDEKYQNLFTGEQLETIQKHIPWTRRLRDGETTYKGKNVDLLEFLRRERESFLIKPNDDYGGSGIVLGWESSQGEWETALNENLQNSYIAQEKVEVEKVTFPVYSDEIRMEELLIDFDPFLFLGKAHGGLVRLSSSSIVNVAKGGGETALIVMEDV